VIRIRIAGLTTTYAATLGHWLPKLLGSDDTVIGGVAHFRMRFHGDGSLASPSAGHLRHAEEHVRQQRAAGLDRGAFKTLRTLWWWMRHHGPMEAEADLAALQYRDHPQYVAEHNRLRALVARS